MESSPLKRFVARRRVMFSLLVPLVLVLFAQPAAADLAVGLILVATGQGVRIWAAGCISKNLVLACKGPFAHVRNPLYVGSLLIATGYCVMSGLWWSFPVFALFYYWFYYGTILLEEEHLRSALGAPYLRYKEHVPRLLPRLSPWRDCDGPAFSWARVLHNREYQSVIGVTLFSAVFMAIWLFHSQHLFDGL